jgi:hypothetical protein
MPDREIGVVAFLIMSRSRAAQGVFLLLILPVVLAGIASCTGDPSGSTAQSTAPPSVSTGTTSLSPTGRPSVITRSTPAPAPGAATTTVTPSPSAPPETGTRRTIEAGRHAETAWSRPSGNVLCGASSTHHGRPRVRCEIFEHRWKTVEPRPSGCAGEFWGSGVALSDTAAFVCSEDPPGIPDPGSASAWWWHRGDPTSTGFDGRWAALRHDTALLLAPDFRCISRASGMTCRDDRTHHGFTISEQRYQLW